MSVGPNKKHHPFGWCFLLVIPIGIRSTIFDIQSVTLPTERAKEVATSPSAAGGRNSEGAVCAAVDKIEEKRKPDDFVGHRKRSWHKPIQLSSIVRAITTGSSPTRGAKKEKTSRKTCLFFFN